MVPETEGPERRPLMHRMLQRVKRHPVLSVCITLVCILVADLARLPYGELISYKEKRPVMTAFQQAYLDGADDAGERRRIVKTWVPYRSIPKHVIKAVLVSEDAAFWQHSGFDTHEINTAISDAVTQGRRLRGASTITQQLVKNLFLSQSKDPLRKWHEIVLTAVAESYLGKRRILELYMNEIEWGPGIYGVQAAARYYFGKDVSDLTRGDAAFLSAVIPTPRRYTPATRTPYLDKRVQSIRRLMGGRDSTEDRTAVPVPSGTPSDSVMSSQPDSLTRGEE